MVRVVVVVDPVVLVRLAQAVLGLSLFDILHRLPHQFHTQAQSLESATHLDIRYIHGPHQVQ
jgi:hypothetical protein